MKDGTVVVGHEDILGHFQSQQKVTLSKTLAPMRSRVKTASCLRTGSASNEKWKDPLCQFVEDLLFPSLLPYTMDIVLSKCLQTLKTDRPLHQLLRHRL
ncbi:hypothetical protein TNCV_1368201 [Trichonephila clavipes]|nr:hypothetical protein TNCV_1368201 [Trichonephila clavipes]